MFQNNKYTYISRAILINVDQNETSGKGQLWRLALGHLKIRKRVRQKQTENTHKQAGADLYGPALSLAYGMRL